MNFYDKFLEKLKQIRDRNMGMSWTACIALSSIALFSILTLFFVCLNYISYFGPVEAYGKTSAEWGQYGDYVGGLTNPILSLINIILVVILSINLRDVEHRRIIEAQKREDRLIQEAREYEDKRSKEANDTQKMLALNQYRHDAFKDLQSKINVELPDTFAELRKVFNPIARFLSDYNYYNGYLFTPEYAKAISKMTISAIELSLEGDRLKNSNLPPDFIYFTHGNASFDSEDAQTNFDKFVEAFTIFNRSRQELKAIIQHIILDIPYVEKPI